MCPTLIDTLQQKFGGSSNRRSLYNRAIRGDYPFGNDLLLLSDILHKIGHRQTLTREAKALMPELYSHVFAIKNALIDDIIRRYSNPDEPQEVNIDAAVELAENWLLVLNEHREQEWQKDALDAIKASRRLVKIILKRKYGMEEKYYLPMDEDELL